MAFELTWRWFGANDEVKLTHLKQFDVEGIVTALHHLQPGEIWPFDEIAAVKGNIQEHGMKWSVAESLPVSEGIKLHSADYDRLVSNYIKSLENLGENRVDTVCYNFMPLIDWVRTDLKYTLPSGGEVMYFEYLKYIVLDVFILKRKMAENSYSKNELIQAKNLYASMSKKEVEEFAYQVIVHTQGFISGNFREGATDYINRFLEMHQKYDGTGEDELRRNLARFLTDVLPTAEKYGIKMAIHPDDPPFSVFGLPRIVSSQKDIHWILSKVNSPSNGLTFCSGSLSVRKENNLQEIIETFKDKVFFAHLRNNHLLQNGDFYESGHLEGNVDIVQLIKLLLEEQMRREVSGTLPAKIPVRADHGIKMLDDFERNAPPGYPLIGRLKGLMEIKGVAAGIEAMLNKQKN